MTVAGVGGDVTAAPVPYLDTRSAVVSAERRLLGRVAVGIWLAGLVAFCLREGIPFDRATQTLWILSGFAVIAIGRPGRRMVTVLRDWGAFIAVLYLYDYSRGAATLLGRPIQVTGPIEWDQAMFGGVVPTTWLQSTFYDPAAVHWYDVVGSLVYISHFLLAWVIAGVLYVRNRELWFRWARALVVLSFSALVVFIVMPAAPPWYADEREGLLPPIERISTRGLGSVGLHQAEALVDQGRAVTNEVAAIPSLHTGIAVLVSLFFIPLIARQHRWWLWPLLAVYPVVMLAMLVYSGEHYVVDGIIGAAFAGATLLALARWDAWREARRAPAYAASAHPRPQPVTSGPPHPHLPHPHLPHPELPQPSGWVAEQSTD